jgi:hypothetical protein
VLSSVCVGAVTVTGETCTGVTTGVITGVTGTITGTIGGGVTTIGVIGAVTVTGVTIGTSCAYAFAGASKPKLYPIAVPNISTSTMAKKPDRIGCCFIVGIEFCISVIRISSHIDNLLNNSPAAICGV